MSANWSATSYPYCFGVEEGAPPSILVLLTDNLSAYRCLEDAKSKDGITGNLLFLVLRRRVRNGVDATPALYEVRTM